MLTDLRSNLTKVDIHDGFKWHFFPIMQLACLLTDQPSKADNEIMANPAAKVCEGFCFCCS